MKSLVQADMIIQKNKKKGFFSGVKVHPSEVLVGEGARSLLHSALGEPGSLWMLYTLDFIYTLGFEYKPGDAPHCHTHSELS